jgi:hypothetical protein
VPARRAGSRSPLGPCCPWCHAGPTLWSALRVWMDRSRGACGQLRPGQATAPSVRLTWCPGSAVVFGDPLTPVLDLGLDGRCDDAHGDFSFCCSSSRIVLRRPQRHRAITHHSCPPPLRGVRRAAAALRHGGAKPVSGPHRPDATAVSCETAGCGTLERCCPARCSCPCHGGSADDVLPGVLTHHRCADDLWHRRGSDRT